jgi:hypothetical protein
MRINIDPTIGEKGRWADGIRRANHILERVIGQSSGPEIAAWTLSQDERKRPLLLLRLSDSSSFVEGKFDPEELEDGEQLWFRLNRLWGDLLQVQSHKQLQRLLELGSSEE